MSRRTGAERIAGCGIFISVKSRIEPITAIYISHELLTSNMTLMVGRVKGLAVPASIRMYIS